MTTFTQLTTRLKTFLRDWLLILGLKEGLVDCATVQLQCGLWSNLYSSLLESQERDYLTPFFCFFALFFAGDFFVKSFYADITKKQPAILYQIKGGRFYRLIVLPITYQICLLLYYYFSPLCITPESGIGVAPLINVAFGKFDQKNKRNLLKCVKFNNEATFKYHVVT